MLPYTQKAQKQELCVSLDRERIRSIKERARQEIEALSAYELKMTLQLQQFQEGENGSQQGQPISVNDVKVIDAEYIARFKALQAELKTIYSYTRFTLEALDPQFIDLKYELNRPHHQKRLIPLGYHGFDEQLQDYEQYITLAMDDRLTLLLNIWLRDAPIGQGEASQHMRNDGLLYPLLHLATDGRGICERLDKVYLQYPVTRFPDYKALFDNVAIFIVEERADDGIDDAIKDVQDKFRWTRRYRNLPFFIALAFSFNDAAIILIQKDLSNTVVKFPIRSMKQRFHFLEQCLYITQILKHFVQTKLNTSLSCNQ